MSAALDVLASLVIDDGRRWGEAASPLQWGDAAAVLDVTGPRRHWLGRAKGYSKTGDVAGLSLAVLLTQLRPGAEAYAAATDADQAGLLLRAIRGYVARTPGLSERVVIESRRVVVPDRGTELVVLPADSAGANGLRPAWLVLDELANWSEDERHRSFLEALLAGLPKVADSRLVAMSTAGPPGHFAERYFMTAGSAPGWRRSDVHGPSPWMDPADIDEARRTLMPATFARWFDNRWTGGDDRLATWEQLRRAATLAGPQLFVPGRRYFGGVDLGLAHDRTAIAVVHGELVGDGRVQSRRYVLDRLVVRQGARGDHVDLEEVERIVLNLSEHYRGVRWRIDPWQAALLSQRLRSQGVSVEQRAYSEQLFSAMATKLAELFREDLIAIPDDQALIDELATVQVRNVRPAGSGSTLAPGRRMTT